MALGLFGSYPKEVRNNLKNRTKLGKQVKT